MQENQDYETEYDYNANQGRGITPNSHRSSDLVVAWIIALIFIVGAIWSVIKLIDHFKN